MTRRLRVLLLFGGRSAEHDVSRVSAAAVAGALDPKRYDVTFVGITPEGRWLLTTPPGIEKDAGGFVIHGEPVALITDPTRPRLVRLASSRGEAPGTIRSGDTGDDGPFDVVFPVLHGPFGEDGTVQGLLELAGIPYVGSGVVGSAVAMDKVMAKRAFAAAGLPIAEYLALRGDDVGVDEIEAALGFPCFVKPANLGSSIGVSKAVDHASLVAALASAYSFDEWVLVEEAIVGREIAVGVLGDLVPEASVPGEIVPAAEFYTYEDKYLDNAATFHAPARLSDGEVSEAQRLAIEAFVACRCDGMARVDLFLSPTRGFVVNEVNTIPGFTPISLYPRLWELSGLCYSALVDRLIELALARHARRVSRVGHAR